MLDHMSGLRRVTLNSNPLIADRGATFLAEVIEADLWIKGRFYIDIKEKRTFYSLSYWKDFLFL
jgi:hypothetical protein